jgi:NTP pyrophosphatase (non-canonical NTP hydrolase)
MGYPSYDYTFERYQEEAARTVNHPDESKEMLLAVFALGVAGEAGEVADLMKKWLGHKKPRDLDAMKKELGDVLWYIAGVATLLDLSMEEIAKGNIEKLRKRYPDGFNYVDANKARK